VSKIVLKKGTYRISKSKIRDDITAIFIHLLLKTPIFKIGYRSERAVYARTSSELARVMNAIVSAIKRSCFKPTPKAKRVINVIATVCIRTPFIIKRLMIGSFGGRGFCCMMSGSPFSVPRASAGAPSVTRLSNNNCIGASGENTSPAANG